MTRTLRWPVPDSTAKESGVAFDVAAVLVWNIGVEIDRVDRAFGNACSAIDALVGIDEHLNARKPCPSLGLGNRAQLLEWNRADDAVARTNIDALGVTGSDALFRDDVTHALGRAAGVPRLTIEERVDRSSTSLKYR
jgi:hypothetical protein